MKDISVIVKYFVLFKSLQLIIVYFTPVQFDTSSQLIIEKYRNDKLQVLSDWKLPFQISDSILSNIIDKFITWDAVYFSDLFLNDIKYEHQFVFCPLWWRIIKWIPIGEGNYYKKLMLGMLCSNICHLGTCIILYYLTFEMFKTSSLFTKTLREFSLISSIIYIISPAGIFLTASYSESPCALFSMASIYLREISINRENFNHLNSKNSLKTHWIYKVTYLLSGTMVSIAYGIRGNCLLLGAMFLFDLYEFGIRNRDITDSILSLASGGQIFVSIIALNWYTYAIFCPARGEWCQSWIPSLFSYAQSHYWNVGFFNYWSLANIPNFLFALPTIVLTLQSFKHFTEEKPVKNLLPVMIVNGMLLVGAVFWWHVQILTRISSFLPLMYWFVASMWISDSPTYKRYSENTMKFMIGWNLIQTSMFAAFLPPA